MQALYDPKLDTAPLDPITTPDYGISHRHTPTLKQQRKEREQSVRD
jgi:hypothetical protein